MTTMTTATATKPTPTRTPAIAISSTDYGRGFTGLTLDGVPYMVQELFAEYVFVRCDGLRKSRSTVRVVAGRPQGCTCPDAQYRKTVCKHQIATREALLPRW